MSRLKKLRKACGKKDAEDDDKKGSGDPFRDLAEEMATTIRQTREDISERNELSKKGLNNDHDTIEKSHGINKELMELDINLKQLADMLDKSETDLNKAIAKKKKPQKIQLFENLVKDRRTLYNGIKATLEDLKELNSKRVETKAGMNPEQIKMTNKRSQLKDILMAGGSAGGVKTTGQAAKLEDDVEMKDVLQKINENEKKIDKGLDMLLAGVKQLGEHARNIGRELDSQATMMDNIDDKMNKREEELKGINGRLANIIKAYKPQNTLFTIACCVLLIAMIGYLVYEFAGLRF
jgi:methyl-accepting chemotaxis protein